MKKRRSVLTLAQVRKKRNKLWQRFVMAQASLKRSEDREIQKVKTASKLAAGNLSAFWIKSDLKLSKLYMKMAKGHIAYARSC